jgi:ATP-binding cassette subfamily F protein uup
MGPNGSGKTTFLRMLAQELKPAMGTLKYAEDLSIVYFDQYRFALPPGGTLRTALCPHGDFVHFRGQDIHVNGWCKRFLFAPDLLDMPLSALSGGEKARLLIAKLMLQPADILLLDEPTNDLDIPTLELLEENLQGFAGAVVLITHDRYLLARVCNQILSLGDTSPPPLFADYSHWEEWQREKEKPRPAKPSAGTQVAAPPEEKKQEKKQKLSWKEQRENEELEKKIPLLEEKIAALHIQVGDPSLQGKPQELLALCKALQEAEKELEKLYTRWGDLQIYTETT